MTTLYDALLDMSRYSGITVSGKTTAAGSSLYLVDTTRYEVGDYFNYGTLFIRSGDCAGITRIVSDYTQSSGKVEFQPAADTTIAADVHYTLTNVNRGNLVQAINEALLTMGQYTGVDDSLSVVDNTSIYSLPSGVSNVKRVEVAVQSGDPQTYYRLYNWMEYNGKLIFTNEIWLTAGRTIRIYYPCYHSEVNDDTDIIRDEYNRERLAWTATAMYLLNRMQYSGNADERETFLYTQAMARAEEMKIKHPIHGLTKDPRLGSE